MSKTFRARRSQWDDDYNDNDNPRRVNKFKKIRESRQQRDLEENLQYENDDDVSKSNITY
jgi:hypothetical protein